MSKKLQEELAAKLEKVEKALKEATDFADEHELTFEYYPIERVYRSWDTYIGGKEKREAWSEGAGWQSSSAGCDLYGGY